LALHKLDHNVLFLDDHSKKLRGPIFERKLNTEDDILKKRLSRGVVDLNESTLISQPQKKITLGRKCFYWYNEFLMSSNPKAHIQQLENNKSGLLVRSPAVTKYFEKNKPLTPFCLLPTGIDEKYFKAGNTKEVEKKKNFNFLCTASYGFEEEGLDFLIDSFLEEFADNKNVFLTIKIPESKNKFSLYPGNKAMESNEVLYFKSVTKTLEDRINSYIREKKEKFRINDSKIVVLIKNFKMTEYKSFLLTSDCFIKMPRVFGFDNEVLEALVLGRLTIYPRNIFPRDILSKCNGVYPLKSTSLPLGKSTLTPINLETILCLCNHYSIKNIRNSMRSAFNKKSLSVDETKKNRLYIFKNYSWENAAKKVLEFEKAENSDLKKYKSMKFIPDIPRLKNLNLMEFKNRKSSF